MKGNFVEDRRDDEVDLVHTLTLGADLASGHALTQHDLLGNDTGFTLKNVLSRDECTSIMEQGRAIGLTHVNKGRGDYRNNERVLIQSQELADIFWERIKPFIHPITIGEKCDDDSIPPSMDNEGIWEPYGLNSLLRLCRYGPGGHFAPHCDGQYKQDPEHRSYKTFMIYLNDEYTGGATNFLQDQELWKDPSDGKYKAQPGTITSHVKADTGEALIFNHHILHEGAAVVGSEKWILRSDVMFRRQAGSGRVYTDSERDALEWLGRAQSCEDNGELDTAMKYYRKAWRLWPELEFQ